MNNITSYLNAYIKPWYHSLSNPEESQKKVLKELLYLYSLTDYGKKYKADKITNYKEFQSTFPIQSYKQFLPYIEEIKNGNYSALLSEKEECWVMTRGTTGSPKLIPVTKYHLSQILSVGSRAIINYALKNNLEVLVGNVLNLNFPSNVSILNTKKGEQNYGYSSGTYAKYNPIFGKAKLIPKQEEIDSLGGGISKKDWENRFELAYNRAIKDGINTIMGVTPVITSFAKYVSKKYHIFPKNIWDIKALFCTSVSKIQTKYSPILKHYFGKIPIIEMYTATEGVFAQQIDDKPFVQPNYDTYLFEVLTRKGTKLIYQMNRGEWGKIIISTSLFPRYDIGDMIEYLGKGYFRIFGRFKWITIIEHIMFNILTARFF